MMRTIKSVVVSIAASYNRAANGMVALGRPGVWRTAADEKVAVALPRSFAGTDWL